MAPVVRIPSEADLPRGTVRDFVEVLFNLYREAHRPTLRQISQEIERSDLHAAASPETIRRMLRGASVPRQWPIVKAVLVALCNIAKTDPDESFGGYRDDSTRREELEGKWHKALDNPDLRYRQPARTGGAADDPWATSGSGGDSFSDEPPF
jgi:hypothetical protein